MVSLTSGDNGRPIQDAALQEGGGQRGRCKDLQVFCCEHHWRGLRRASRGVRTALMSVMVLEEPVRAMRVSSLVLLGSNTDTPGEEGPV